MCTKPRYQGTGYGFTKALTQNKVTLLFRTNSPWNHSFYAQKVKPPFKTERNHIWTILLYLIKEPRLYVSPQCVR